MIADNAQYGQTLGMYVIMPRRDVSDLKSPARGHKVPEGKWL